MKKVAILVDGEFFLKRFNRLSRNTNNNKPEYVIKVLHAMCRKHAVKARREIYRIFFYDCSPYENGMHNPLSGRFIQFKNSNNYKFRVAFHEKLREQRKVALRLGYLHANQDHKWLISPQKIKELLQKKISIDDLDPEKDIIPNFRQKQVDMKIGVDITSLALKKHIDTIILIAGDGDFVPAAKLARREGIDFILDPMWNPIHPQLFEHIDGLTSVFFNNNNKQIKK
ncbi:MAG: NYN domain-containing protein [Victivallaceae bacterium]|nr:NYN domain-containing protein [Victivallaceae bacterium]